jgi:nucleoside-diphosphate-sugar epimerase
MRIVGFGPNGMIGSEVVAELDRRGHRVTGASRSTGTDINRCRSSRFGCRGR